MKEPSKFQQKGPGYRYSDLSKQCTEHVKKTGSPDEEAKAMHRAKMEAIAPLDNRKPVASGEWYE